MFTQFRHHLLSRGLGLGTAELYVNRLEQTQRVHPDLLAVELGDLEQFLSDRRGNLAANTRKTYRSAWRAFYRWALREQMVTHDPTAGLEAVRVPSTVPLLAPDDTLQLALLSAPLDEQHMILAGRMGCLRLSEITHLHTRDRHGDVFRVRGKGDKVRNVPINSDWLPVVLKLEAERGAGYYLPGRYGGALHISTVGRKITVRTGYNPHALRHAGATAAYEGSKDLRAVQELLGHASLATTEQYLHTSLQKIRTTTESATFRTRAPNPHDVDRVFRVEPPVDYQGRFRDRAA